MAIMLSKISEGNIEVISKIDSALKEVTDEQYSEYLKTLDESLLRFHDGEQPTRFVMRKVLPYGIGQKIKNNQMRMEKGEMQIQMGFMTEEVRAALIDIKNPVGIPEEQQIKFKRGSDGSASEDLLALLDAAGIVNDLFAARKNYMEKSVDNVKKN
jgi:hypothetical protein